MTNRAVQAIISPLSMHRIHRKVVNFFDALRNVKQNEPSHICLFQFFLFDLVNPVDFFFWSRVLFNDRLRSKKRHNTQ